MAFEDPHIHPHFIENAIDRQIDHLLESVKASLESIEASLRQAERSHRAWAEGRSDGSEVDLNNWREAVEKVEREASRLHGLLRPIFLDLPHRSEAAESMREGESGSAFDLEMELIRRRFESARSEVVDTLFEAGSTIHVGRLQERNMLTELDEVRRVAGEVKRAGAGIR